jgi:hypothetical protein
MDFLKFIIKVRFTNTSSHKKTSTQNKEEYYNNANSDFFMFHKFFCSIMSF